MSYRRVQRIVIRHGLIEFRLLVWFPISTVHCHSIEINIISVVIIAMMFNCEINFICGCSDVNIVFTVRFHLGPYHFTNIRQSGTHLSKQWTLRSATISCIFQLIWLEIFLLISLSMYCVMKILICKQMADDSLKYPFRANSSLMLCGFWRNATKLASYRKFVSLPTISWLAVVLLKLLIS